MIAQVSDRPTREKRHFLNLSISDTLLGVRDSDKTSGGWLNLPSLRSKLCLSLSARRFCQGSKVQLLHFLGNHEKHETTQNKAMLSTLLEHLGFSVGTIDRDERETG
jgi:hypothetical protein